jgi:hypothetical protein
MDWDNFGSTINNAFYFVVDKIIDLQGFFMGVAWNIGSFVLVISISLAALNYALTGTGLKENIIKILKATLFFLIVFSLYPRIIGFISSWTFDMAQQSIGRSVEDYFNNATREVESRLHLFEYAGSERVIDTRSPADGGGLHERHRDTYTVRVLTRTRHVRRYDRGLFSDMSETRTTPRMTYTTIAPANVLKIILLLAGECFKFAEQGNSGGVFDRISGFSLSNALKGIICGFFLILTGAFALLEYIVCFLEFMLVASVGIILFPLSLWEGSKFMSEKFIGALVGFFIKLLLCNVAIFLLLYGYISLFYIMNEETFTGTADQIVFIVFISLLFFYICKSAPGIAQSLLSGTPSLSATGAISAVGGAIAAAGATMSLAKGVSSKAAGVGAKATFGAVGSLTEASAASSAVKAAGGSGLLQAGAFMNSLGKDAWDSMKAGGLGLTRNLLAQNGSGGTGSGGTNPHSWRQDFLNRGGADGSQTLGEHFAARKEEGAERGRNFAQKFGLSAPAAPTQDTPASPSTPAPAPTQDTPASPSTPAPAPTNVT